MARRGGPKPLYIAVNGALGLHCGDSELFWSVLVLQWDALGLHSGCFGLPVLQKFVIPERPAAEGSRLEDSGVWGWRRAAQLPEIRDGGGSVLYCSKTFIFDKE